MDSKSFSVVNGEELEYSGMYIANGDINVAKFYDKAVAEGFTLKQGSNTIQLRVNANTIRAAIPGAGLLATASRYLPTQTLPGLPKRKTSAASLFITKRTHCRHL